MKATQTKAQQLMEQVAQEEVPAYETPEVETAPDVPEPPRKKRFETSKLIVWICLINGFLWVWCSYILAAMDKIQIAESLSQVAVTEIIGVVLAHCIKTAVENLSKNNNWPDKPPTDGSGLG